MASSSRVAGALLVALLAVAAFLPPAGLLSGCAHAGAARSDPPRAATAPPGGLDPSEEITAEELASIPEPVPAARRPAAPPKAASRAPGEAPEARSTAVKPETPAAPVPISTPPPSATPDSAVSAIGGAWVWRVQILATPDRALAERVAREAAERLGTTSRIDTEPPLHKVRLGGFGSEADAQILKSRAVEMGYPGAFRVKIRAAATDE